MGNIELSKDGKEFTVFLTEREDLAVMKAAFKATPASDDLSQTQGLETYSTSLDSLGNICALWATGFSWSKDALRVLVDYLMPLAQRKNSYRTASAFDKRDPRQGEQLPR